jgi:hypothetical protein
MSILNSITGGFGFRIGSNLANSLMSSNGSSTIVVKDKASLSFWQVIKTILWSIPMLLIAFIIAAITTTIGSTASGIVTFTLWILFTFIIGYQYYTNNKKAIEWYNNRNNLITQAQNIIDETEKSYIAGRITKREYEVLIKKANKILNQYK